MLPADHTTTNIRKEGSDTAVTTTKETMDEDHPYHTLIPMAKTTTTTTHNNDNDQAKLERDSSNEDEDAGQQNTHHGK